MSAGLRLSSLSAAVVLLAGCGGSSHRAASGATSGTATTVSTSPATTTTHSAQASTSTSVSVSSRDASSTTSGSSGSHAPGSGGAGLAPAGGTAAGGSIDARVPATFTLGAAGTLSPGQVSAPAFVAVAVRINSGSAAAHLATIATPHPVRLRIPPHGAAATMIAGLRAGTYPILIDGARSGALVIGGEPGP